jgi:hypothetical protein
MVAHHTSILVRWFLLVSLCLVVLDLSIDLITHPAVVTTAGIQLPIYFLLFALAILIYGWFALFRTRAASADERIALQRGTFWGLLCGGVWIIELLVANLLGPQLGWLNLVLYYGSARTGYLLPGLAGLLAAWESGRIKSGLQAALLTGIFGGLMIFLASIALFPLFQGAPDPQTIREFQHSGLPNSSALSRIELSPTPLRTRSLLCILSLKNVLNSATNANLCYYERNKQELMFLSKEASCNHSRNNEKR